MKKLVRVWTPTYTAEGDDFTYLWQEVGRKAYGIRVCNARLKYYDGREEFMPILDAYLRPDSGITWGYREVRQNAK